MSFDLAVLAMDESADAATVRAMFGRCTSDDHDEGEPDERVVGFYAGLRSRFPDRPPYAAESPWMSTPLAVGIDHVIMNLSSSSRSDAAIEAIEELAEEFPAWSSGTRSPRRPICRGRDQLTAVAPTRSPCRGRSP